MKKLTFIMMLAAAFAGGFCAQSVFYYTAPAFGDAQAQDGVIKATEFQLVTDTGQTRGAFRFARSGEPQLVLMDRGGAERVGISLASSGPEIILTDSAMNQVISLQVEGAKDPLIRLGQSSNEVRLGRLSTGNYGVGLYDSGGKDCGGLAVSPNGAPGLFVIDSSGHLVWKTN